MNHFVFGRDACISRHDNDGDMIGGMLFTHYTGKGGSVAIHMAGWNKHWANRDLIWACFHYCFVPLDCKKVWGQVFEGNAEALKINEKLGFKVENRVKDMYPQGDMLLMSMYKEDCRWLGLKPRFIYYRGHAHG